MNASDTSRRSVKNEATGTKFLASKKEGEERKERERGKGRRREGERNGES